MVDRKASIDDANLVDVVYKYSVCTLINITYSATSKKHTDVFYSTQNYNTFVQACSLRTQIFDPVVTKTTMSVDGLFGNVYTGEMPIWTLSFNTEVPIPELANDIEGIPIHDDGVTQFEVIETENLQRQNTVIK